MSEITDRLAAALSDRYRIEGELGEGGMATVYLAHDLRHDRKVALKVLRPELAAVIGAERFLAEIRTTANLQHPHILPLFDSGEADSFLFYVMPYVEGESLRERLDREKHLPIDDALRIAGALASALDYAHRRDVIHRDIKPENILLHDGQPLVADFGIALALSTAGSSRMTETGMSLGTPTYMSPEQAMGEREIDARADIYSLGCMLYEMLTGDPPFTGSTAQAIAARMLTEPPRPLTTQRHTIPPHVEAAVLTALEKLPADRFATAQAFAEALNDPSRAAGLVTPARRTAGAAITTGWRATLRQPVVWALALLTLASSGLALRGWLASRGARPDAVVRFRVDLPPGFQPSLSDAQGPDLAISRDGSTVAFPAIDDQSVRRIYVRRLDEAAARALPGTEEAYLPTFSPDGTSIAFWAAGRVQRVSLGGGAPQVVGEYGNVISLAWIGSDELLIGDALVGSLKRIAVTGGEARPAAPLDSVHGETGQLYPVVLSDGRHVLYESWGRGAAEDAHIGVLDLSAGRARRLDFPGTGPLGMLDGRLVYTDQTGTILAVPLDLESGDVEGQPVPVGDSVATGPRGTGVAALSATGTLAYQGGSRDATLVLADPSGQQVPVLPDVRPYAFPRYSPDGTRIAVAIASGSSSDIWVADVASGGVVRLTTGGTTNDRPEWTPDGTRVLFRAVRDTRSGIWWQPADRSAPATPLLEDDDAQYFEGVLTPDGRSLVYQIDTAQADVMVKELPDGTPRVIADTPASDDQARISPDGRWVALVSGESGVPQVVVLPLSGRGAPVQISLRGGREPVWSRDDRSLFYRAEGKFKVAEVSSTPAFHVVSRRDFMDDVFMPTLAPHANYDVGPDGKKLLVLEGELPQLLVVHNWAEEVRARLEEGKRRGG